MKIEKIMHPVDRHRQENDYLKRHAKLLFKYRELILGHAWFPYVPVPLMIPSVEQIPLGALLELAGDNGEEFCRLCDDAAWLEPLVLGKDPRAAMDPKEAGDDSPAALFEIPEQHGEGEVGAVRAAVRERIRDLVARCESFHPSVPLPPGSDLKGVVDSLRRAGRLAYLTDNQLAQLRSRLHLFEVHDSLEELENCLIDDFLEMVIPDCNEGSSATFRPVNFRYFWLQVQAPGHFTAHYAKDRNVCLFTEYAGVVNSFWSMRRAQEEYLQALYVSRFDEILHRAEEAVRKNPDLQIEGCNPEKHTFSLVHRSEKDYPALTLWDVLESYLEEDSEWIDLMLDDGGNPITDEELEQLNRERDEAQRQLVKKLIPAQADLLQRIIEGTASEEDLAQCVELCHRIEWGERKAENEENEESNE